MSDKPQGMKSAYELALERLEKQGIKRPEDSQLTDEDRRQMAEARSRAEAKLAEMEILHRDRSKSPDPMKRQEDEEHYMLERRRVEEERDRKIEAIRRGKS